jgi:poly(3-hydroxybutyrate) depolymerase
MTRIRLAVSLLLCVLLWHFAFAAPKADKHTLTFAGKKRTYYTVAPEKVTGPAPLLLLLHGAGRDGMSQIAQWNDLATKQGVILVAPDALDRKWQMAIDGPEFLHQVVEEVRAKYPVDGRRMYVFGHSSGAVFGLYMTVMEGEYFASGGVHAGSIFEDFYPFLDASKRKAPLAIWYGTDDPNFTPAMVNKSEAELKKHGFDIQSFEMKHHDHDYYAVAKDLNPKIWQFLSNTKLDADPSWQTYK